jgi:hypothetical protein
MVDGMGTRRGWDAWLKSGLFSKKREGPVMINRAGILAVFALCSLVARGAELDEPSPVTEEAAVAGETVPLEACDEESCLGGIFISGGCVGSSNMKDREAAYAVDGVEVGVSLGPVSSSFKTLAYSWDKPELFPGNGTNRDPWERLNEITVMLTGGGAITDRLQYSLLGGITSGYEEEMDDSYCYFAGGYGIYTLTPDWDIMAGAIYSRYQKVDTDLDVIPVVGVSWNATTTNGLSISLGVPTTEISWHFNEKTSLSLDMSSFEGGVYRLADDNPIRKKGYVEFESSTYSLRLDTMLGSRIQLSSALFQSVARDIRLYDAEGKNRVTHEVDNNVGIMTSVSVAF